MRQIEAYEAISRLLVAKQYSVQENNDLSVALSYLGMARAELEKLEKKKEDDPLEMEPSPSDTGTRAVGE